MGWRDIDIGRIADSASDLIKRRVAGGKAKYGARFVGDPLDEAIEEAADQLVYLIILRDKLKDKYKE